MPYFEIRLPAAALLLLSGCALPSLFTASANNKPIQEPAASSGPSGSKFTNSWSGSQNAKPPPQDIAATAGTAAGDSERRIQDLLATGERCQSAGDRRAARIAFEQALRLAPGDASVNYQLAIMDDEEGHFADAERHYFAVMKQTPNDPNVLSSLGWSYLLQGRYDDSDRILREALRYDPDNKFALNNLGMLYGTRGDYDGALAIFRMAGSEADAQQALALLKQNAGTIPVAGTQYSASSAIPTGPELQDTVASVPGNGIGGSSSNAVGNLADARRSTGLIEPDTSNPQGRKFAEDYKRLMAENDKKQQEKRAKLAQKNMSAPSPWSNRQNAANAGQPDSGRTIPVQGLVQQNSGPANLPAFRRNSADPAQIRGGYPANDAAFPGAAPSQANRPRQAGPAELEQTGNVPAAAAALPAFNPGTQPIRGTQAIYEQPAGVRSQAQPRSPVITPAGELPASRGNNAPTWNSLPPDDSNRGNSNGGNVASPAGRLTDWPQNNAGNLGSTDASRNGAGQPAAGQLNAPQPRGTSSRQEAQTTAAQLGLSAGSGGLGFPASDWPNSSNGQPASPGSGMNPPGGLNSPGGSQIPPSSQNSLGGQNGYNAQPTGQQPIINGQSQGFGPSSQPSNGQPSNGQPSNGPASSLPPWPGRPLSGGTVPPSVVPSGQAMVYGATGDSGMPNFYSGRPSLPPVR